MIKSLAGSNAKTLNIKNNRKKLEGIKRVSAHQSQPKKYLEYSLGPSQDRGTQGDVIDFDDYYDYAVNELYE